VDEAETAPSRVRGGEGACDLAKGAAGTEVPDLFADAPGDVHRVVARKTRARPMRYAGAGTLRFAAGAAALAAPGPEREIELAGTLHLE
jgi:hypothetical protein